MIECRFLVAVLNVLTHNYFLMEIDRSKVFTENLKRGNNSKTDAL